MFARRKTLAPPSRPFQHADRCRTPDADPQWHEAGDGRWERVCSCETELAFGRSGELDPNSPGAEPSRRAHQHEPDCPAADMPAVVDVVRDEADGGWRSRCSMCETVCRYFWQPEYYEPDEYGEPRRVTRLANVQFVYELAHQQVSLS